MLYKKRILEIPFAVHIHSALEKAQFSFIWIFTQLCSIIFDFLEDLLQANPDNFPRGQVNAPSRRTFSVLLTKWEGRQPD